MPPGACHVPNIWAEHESAERFTKENRPAVRVTDLRRALPGPSEGAVNELILELAALLPNSGRHLPTLASGMSRGHFLARSC